MRKKLTGWYRTLKHNINYKEGYFNNLIIALFILLAIDLIILYLIR